jgi:hypothetical protein
LAEIVLVLSTMARMRGSSKSPTATEMELMAETRMKLLPRPVLASHHKVLIYAVGGVGGTGLAWVRFGGWFVVVGEIGD